MIPITQTKVVVRNAAGEMVVRGNCYAACIASLLEMQITDVPNVEVLFGIKSPERFHVTVMDTWLISLGYELKQSHKFKLFHDPNYIISESQGAEWMEEMKDKFYMASGDSPRGVKHSVIYQNGIMVHDPHPSRDGLLSLDYFTYIEKIQAF